MSELIGKIISHYHILEQIGQGGMGVVYKAEDTKLKRSAALKFIPPELTRDPKAKKRFIHEAQAASALEHNNICTIYEIDEIPTAGREQMFIAMACYEGESLKERIERGALPIEEAIDIAIQIAQGLAKAHSKQIVHRDIKPANILLTEDDQVKIVDFGLAKLAGRTMLTKEGTTLGTVAYMSPEQTQGADVDSRTDIWALGVVLYEMLTGQLPFKGDYEQAVVYSILNEDPEPVGELIEHLPFKLSEIVQKTLEKEVGERYQSMSELLADLNAAHLELQQPTQQEKEKSASSIAVLPFDNMSADPEQEYFCDGMAEEIINALTHIENLHVVARTSAFAFKGQSVDIREIGRKLNVEHVLEGSVRKAGNRLRITAQLIKVVDGYHLWSERFDRELDDVFTIQDEISLAIVDKLKIRLLSGEKAKLVKRYTENLEAYSLYLKGLYYWNSLTPEGWAKSLECYQQAVDMDPNYALAYLGLSIWHQSLAFWGEVHPREAFSQSRELALKAVELDDTLSDAHNCLAVIGWCYDWNWAEAKIEFEKALALESANAFAPLNFALASATRKSFDNALLYARLAQKLDPLSSLVNTWAASILTYSGQYEASVGQFQQIIASDPDPWQPYYNLSVAFLYQEKFKDAVSAAEEAVKRSGDASIAKTFLGCACALDGQVQQAREQLNSLLERRRQKYVPSTFFVWLYIALQEIDEAYGWLQKAVEDHDPWLCWYGISPPGLHASDPRFDALLKSNGLIE